MGRTPFLWFVNVYAEYNLNLGGRYRLQFNLNIDNLLNVDIARRTWSRLTRGRVTVTNDDLISKTWDLPADFLRDPRFEQPLEFYPPISARIGVKLVF
jgi:hypothetical protein